MADSPRVVFPLYNGSTLLDFAGATQIFSFAGFQTVWAAPTMDPITTTENVQVLPGCTFADVTAQPIAGLLDGYEASTYWSQRENLTLFSNIRVSAGYPRWVIHGTRFTGGGISSSIDLALELVSLISGPTQSMSTQLGTQYAPDPPFSSGDPGQAPPEVTTAARQSQGDFIATIRLAVEKVLGKV
ncbi:MAG TPA: hypothetical protein VGK45_06865 [Thermoanaerobaculia bacterium]|jgi:cyclohexyl-isocyanide hydratase